MLGLRPGEFTGLRWSDVDLDNAQLLVEVSLKHERDGLRLGDTKTPGSRRPLTLHKPVVEALHVQKSRQHQERVKAGAAWQDSGLAFTTEIGTPMDPANLRHVFATLAIRAGLGRWTLNELRHSAASLLSAAGVPLEDALSHSSTRMLEQHYRHRIKPAIDAHVGVMERIFATGIG